MSARQSASWEGGRPRVSKVAIASARLGIGRTGARAGAASAGGRDGLTSAGGRLPPAPVASRRIFSTSGRPTASFSSRSRSAATG